METEILDNMKIKKLIYKTEFTLTVLSEERIENRDIKNILQECDDGDLIGATDIHPVFTVLEGKSAVDAVYKLGSTPDFFQMDDNGYEIPYF